MTLWLSNLGAYSVQLLALVLTAACVSRLFALRHPTSTAQFWHLVLTGAVALPLLQPWLSAADGDVAARVVPDGLRAANNATTAWPAVMSALWLVWIAGAAWHIGLLVAGLVRLQVLRRRATELDALVPSVSRLNALLGTHADVLVSKEVDCPVTFGVRRATVLLPHCAPDMAAQTVEAVLCHELLHVKRRDWLWTVAEAAWASLLWFHPAARYLVSRSSLARELVVDAQTIAETNDRRAYAQALLQFAGNSTQPATAATPFFTRRHLSDRVAFIVSQEAPMYPSRRFAVTSTALTIVALGMTFVIREVPMLSAAAHDETGSAVDSPHSLRPAAQPARPGNGIVAPSVLYSEKPQYTAEALAAKIQGNVMLDLVVLENGSVGQVTIVKSLDAVHGLDEAATSAAKRWRFKPGTRDGKAVPVTVTIEMTFTLKD